ncbi:MAG: PLP-dependent aminotransferase family protein [Thermomicrobiales bacterium]|nr:PLP-dependent aminotransferase family protein [Thermomicrobiales bacterium]
MPRRAQPTKRPDITLDPGLPAPLVKQLYDRLRDEILSGQLPPGTRLPSTRTLAGELGVSRGTTVLAYEQLQLEGYLTSHVGQGTVVSHQLPITPAPGASAPGAAPEADSRAAQPPRLAAHIHSLRSIPNMETVERDAQTAFLAGAPTLDHFPYGIWARLVARHARRSLPGLAYYQPPAGYLPLREAIAVQVGISRGVRCTAEQIILTTGAQGALDFAARTLLNPGDEAWIEDPGYFGAQGALLAAGARLVPVPVDDQGLDVAVGTTRAPHARLVFTSPSHQFPTGVTMSLGRRLALLNWARQAAAWIVEDDYDSEFRFSGRPLEALQGLRGDGRVLYVGTFSKVLFPTLRLGYLVAPTELADALLLTRRFSDIHIPLLEQLALTDFIQEGHYDRHLRRMRRLYRHRRDLLHAELCRHLGNLLEVRVPDMGMTIVGWLPPHTDDHRAAALATAAGITARPISRYSLEPLPRGGLVLGFAAIDDAGIRRGVRRLAAALDAL